MYVLKHMLNTWTGYAEEYYHEDKSVLEELRMGLDSYPFDDVIKEIVQWDGNLESTLFCQETYDKNREKLGLGVTDKRAEALAKLTDEDREVLGLN